MTSSGDFHTHEQITTKWVLPSEALAGATDAGGSKADAANFVGQI